MPKRIDIRPAIYGPYRKSKRRLTFAEKAQLWAVVAIWLVMVAMWLTVPAY